MKPINLEDNSRQSLSSQSRAGSANLSKGIRLTINLLGILITWLTWFWLINASLTASFYIWIAMGGVILLIPIIYAARWFLDRQPSIQRAYAIAAVIHYLIAIFLGSAMISAVRIAQLFPYWSSPLPTWLGLLLMICSGLVLLAGVIHLLNKGLGLPLGTEVTRLVVSNWLYAWTRNPIVLSSLAFLVGIGLWLGSGPFLLWVLALVFPALFIFLLVFEERELEIRFGKDYLDYKRQTPMLWPRRPNKDTQ